jgi:hypothetical protein
VSPVETPAQWVARTRRAQGLPDHVTDEAALAELARMVLEPADALLEPEPEGDAA